MSVFFIFIPEPAAASYGSVAAQVGRGGPEHHGSRVTKPA